MESDAREQKPVKPSGKVGRYLGALTKLHRGDGNEDPLEISSGILPDRGGGVIERIRQRLRSNPQAAAGDEMSEGTPAEEFPLPDILSEDELPLPPQDPEEEARTMERYWLIPPFAYVKILKNREMDPEYIIVEPEVSEKEFILLEETYEELRNVLIYTSSNRRENVTFDEDRIKGIIRSFDPEIPEDRLAVLIYFLRRNFTGFGKLDPLMHDRHIEDITCNGANLPVFIYHRRYANLATNIQFDDDELNKYALKIAQKANKQMSLTTPLVDAALPGGSRVQLTYSDIISAKGSSFTIRKFKTDPMTPVDLIALDTYNADLMAVIWLCVENNKSMIIAGGTACGKTSTMNAVSFFIPGISKIISIEDTREIQLPHKNWLPLKTREGGKNLAAGDVDMFTLLKASLRQRPEYIIVGEVRGEEAQTLFQAMNTGHTTFSTLHAGGVNEAINRLTHDPINVPNVMFGALDLMLIQGLQYRAGVGFRRCLSLNEIYVEGGNICWNPLYEWNLKTDAFDKVYEHSKTLEHIAYVNGWTAEDLQSQIAIRRDLLLRLVDRKVYDIDTISHHINELRKSTYHAA